MNDYKNAVASTRSSVNVIEVTKWVEAKRNHYDYYEIEFGSQTLIYFLVYIILKLFIALNLLWSNTCLAVELFIINYSKY